ncbi:hypothetical protein PILCRDRAFT_378448 [Piloderma croceum F 1598]|uniref:Uncharacterized protein n=1 Tax=Piloderma croceum (strain F 1598) TaxID=765440 RepID=A0A0C3C5S2_PILCF|nr:hypothetical protein PILCRDRAFT_378448 [Piloderma croceum F 1598]
MPSSYPVRWLSALRTHDSDDDDESIAESDSSDDDYTDSEGSSGSDSDTSLEQDDSNGSHVDQHESADPNIQGDPILPIDGPSTSQSPTPNDTIAAQSFYASFIDATHSRRSSQSSFAVPSLSLCQWPIPSPHDKSRLQCCRWRTKNSWLVLSFWRLIVQWLLLRSGI